MFSVSGTVQDEGFSQSVYSVDRFLDIAAAAAAAASDASGASWSHRCLEDAWSRSRSAILVGGSAGRGGGGGGGGLLAGNHIVPLK